MPDLGGIGRAVADHHRLYVRDQQQHVGVKGFGQQGGGEVLVDDGLHAAQPAGLGVPHHRDTAPAGADHDRPGIEQQPDQAGLHDPLRLWGRHHPAPALPVLAHGPAAFRGQLACLRLGVHRTDELGRCAEGRVGRGDQCLGHQGGDLPVG